MGPHEKHNYRHRTDALFIMAQRSKMNIKSLPQDSITGDIISNSQTHLGPRTFPPYQETLCMTDTHTSHLNSSVRSKGWVPWPHAMHKSWTVIWPAPGATSCSPDSTLLISNSAMKHSDVFWCQNIAKTEFYLS